MLSHACDETMASHAFTYEDFLLIFGELKSFFLFNRSQDHERHFKRLDSVNAVHGLFKWRPQSC